MFQDLINQTKQIWRSMAVIDGEKDYRRAFEQAFEIYVLSEFDGVGVEVLNFLKREGDLVLKRKVGYRRFIFNLTRKFECIECGGETDVYEFWIKGSVLGSQPIYWHFKIETNIGEPGARIELNGTKCQKCGKVYLLHDIVPDIFWKGLKVSGKDKQKRIDLAAHQISNKPLVHCALPSRLHKKSLQVNDFVGSQGCGPFNPFDAFQVSRFEKGCMGRKRTMEICLKSVEMCDEMWVFGISEGVLAELKRMMDLNKIRSERHQKLIKVYADKFDPEWQKYLSSFVGDPRFAEQINFLRQKMIGV